MGKVHITDENNNSYTGRVTSNGAQYATETANKFYSCNSAHNLVGGSAVYDGACWLKSILIGQAPATSTTVFLYDCSTGVACAASAFGTSGANIIARIGVNVSGDASAAPISMAYPATIPLNVYCTSGLTYAIGLSAADVLGRIGAMRGLTLIYQTA